ncbi:MAG: ABC transporter ATP-binding protein [Thermoplasmata archaeon]
MTDIAVRELALERGGFRLGPIDLAIPGGSATVVLGPSGAGKTTLLRALAGFLGLRTGSITIDGVPMEHEAPERRGFGFVPPSLGLFPDRRVERNVSYALDLVGDPSADEELRGWMERFDLVRLARKYPSELSSGERQRVAMARALASHPRFLLWDEPLNALDVESRDASIRLLRDLIEEHHLPLLLVTHDPSTAIALASRLVVLEQGRVRFNGRPEELAAAPIDRFTARFLGYENLYTAAELRASATSPLAAALVRAAGPGGLVVPDGAVRGSGERWVGDTTARVAAVRWAAPGWSIALEVGGLLVHVHASHELPTVRVGALVGMSIDPAKVKPLEESLGIVA